ncbi:tachylectin-related carbohydrate-binding protein [Streptomyces sp. NPDC002463]|uniref:tachylectin-related carbohydrate-binding protein n=1 Tax=Streptomyces sp. NPDC002463 TaxID=3364645 RepID=UPI0036921A2D
MALVIATALAVGVAPALLGGATAVAAPAPVTASTASTGTVTQQGGPLVVPSGEEGPVTTRVTVQLSHYSGGTIKARLLLPTKPYEAGNENPAYRWVTATCAVNGGAFKACGWDNWDNVATLPEVSTNAGQTTLTYDIRVDATSIAAYLGDVPAYLEVSDETGTVTDRGPVAFRFVKGTPEAQYRTTVLARDKAGVLWQYESSGRADKPLKARERIGGGWNVYTSITSLLPRSAAGQGALVARDRDGVLWYYEGSGNPDQLFKPRVRIGGGWNQYTALAGRDGGLVARDKDGRLWVYMRSGSNDPTRMFMTRGLVGTGWNTYNLIASRGDYEAVARDASGVLWSYTYRSGGGGYYEVYAPRTRVGGGWNVYDSVVSTGDLDGSILDSGTSDDFLARDKDGGLWFYAGREAAAGPGSTRRQIGHGWGIYDVIL